MQLVTEDNITELAAQRWASAHDPRTAEVMAALVRHLHAFAREVRLSEPEWMAGVRAKYVTRPDGSYCLQTIAPKGYSIPMDGPVGALIRGTDISHFRPAHVHFLINAAGYEPLITHLFQEGAQYLDSDVVFGTK